MPNSLSEKSVTAFIWAGIDKLGSSSVNFILTIILARLLTPEDFGLVAMVMIFFNISSVFVESGFSAALIREKTISEADKSTAFIFNLVASIFFYILLFIASPYIATFFNQQLLTPIVRIMGLNIVINAIGIIQFTALTQQIDFRTQTKIRFVAVIISGTGAVALAFLGYGVWSLVVRAMLMALATTLIVWIASSWRPSWRFSNESFRRLFGFGSKILVTALIDKIYRNIYDLLIGKFFSAADLGFYKQADSFKNITTKTLLQTIRKVSYPVLSKLKDDAVKLKMGYRKVIKMSSFIIFPAMVLLAILAKPVILTLVGEKWLPSVIFLQLLCLAGATYHINSLNFNMLLVLGKTTLGLKLEVVKKANITLAILVGIQFGLIGLVIAQVVASFTELFINAYYSEKLLKYGLWEQAKDVSISLGFSILAGALVFALNNYMLPQGVFPLAIELVVGGLFFLGLHLLAKTEEMRIIRTLILPKAMQFLPKL